MSLLSRASILAAEPAEVWSTIADLQGFGDWYPEPVEVTVGSVAEGVGATRRRDHGAGGCVDESVSVWDPGKELWFAIEGQGAIRSAEIGYLLRDGDEAGTTRLELIADYHLAMGPVGPVVDSEAMRGHIGSMLDTTLNGLRRLFDRTYPNSSA